MKQKDETMVALYQLLGRIFFAAAQADNVIREEEIATLKVVVNDVWLDAEDTFDEFNSDSAHQIEIVFDYLLENDGVVEDVIGELHDFKRIHRSLFTPELIELIMNTVYKIVSSYAKRNKSELVFISRLRMALEG